MADKAASVLAKLRNKAKASGISYQQCLQLFVQEEFLRKLSKSGYAEFLILKGGLFIYTLTNFESRATIDADFLLRGLSNSIEDVKELIETAAFQREIIKNSKKRILLMPGKKLGRDSFVKVCDADMFDGIITDWTAESAPVKELEEKGIAVTAVGEEE